MNLEKIKYVKAAVRQRAAAFGFYTETYVCKMVSKKIYL